MDERAKLNRAAALKYDARSDQAPRIIAKGRGKVAEKIIQLARDNHIYIHEDPDLIESLSMLDLNEDIPPELYVVVAELLAFIYSLNRQKQSP